MVEMQTVTPVSGSWAKPGEMGGLAQVHCNTYTPYGQQRRPRQVRAKREWRWGEVVCIGGPVTWEGSRRRRELRVMLLGGRVTVGCREKN